jgi:lipoprotein-anchoring transpeptidase ErfK/SrfK
MSTPPWDGTLVTQSVLSKLSDVGMLMPTRRMRRLCGAAGAVLLATALTACGGSSADPAAISSQQPDSPPAIEPSPMMPNPDPVTFKSNVKDGASNVKVDTLVTVSADWGTVRKVKLSYTNKDPQGRTKHGTVSGKISKDRTTWTASDRLEPGAAYKLISVGKNWVNQSNTNTSTFRTQKLPLDKQTYPTIYPLKGSHVGIGMPVVLTFDVPVKNKREFEKNLHVKSSPAQAGTWHWYSSTQVRYRPKKFWKPGTKVSVTADINGLYAGNGVYGQNLAKTHFTVGRSQITKINLSADVARVYRNGKLARTIYVSGGKPGWQTRSGTKLIMDKLYVTKMTNTMIGAREHYSLRVKYAMRITTSGEFLHAAPWNAAYFGRRNASHGCVGMSTANAAWLFNRTLIGDPVITTGSSRGVEYGNGYSDWNVSYAKYKKGSAL